MQPAMSHYQMLMKQYTDELIFPLLSANCIVVFLKHIFFTEHTFAVGNPNNYVRYYA